MEELSQKVKPFLWFQDDAHSVAKFYLSIFKDHLTICSLEDYGNSVKLATIKLFGVTYVLMSTSEVKSKMNDTFSLSILCDDQAEVDYYWSSLTNEGGQEGQCGWCKDKYGLSWQVTPKRLFEILKNSSPEKKAHFMQVLRNMKKLDIEQVEQA